MVWRGEQDFHLRSHPKGESLTRALFPGSRLSGQVVYAGRQTLPELPDNFSRRSLGGSALRSSPHFFHSKCQPLPETGFFSHLTVSWDLQRDFGKPYVFLGHSYSHLSSILSYGKMIRFDTQNTWRGSNLLPGEIV